MRTYYFLIISVLLINASLLNAQTVTLDFEQKKQTIIGNGLNMENYHWTGGTEVLKQSLSQQLQALPSDIVRVGIPLREWEPVNDNDDSEDIDWDGFFTGNDAWKVRNSFDRLKYLKDKGKDLWLFAMDMANWNISNPGNSVQRRLIDMDEFIESILAYLLYAKEHYDVEPKWFCLNEPALSTNGCGGYDIIFTAEEQATLIKKIGKLFEENELDIKCLISVHCDRDLQYMKDIYNTDGVAQYLAGIDIHGYWAQDRPANLKAIGEWMQTIDIPLICGEADYDNSFWMHGNEYVDQTKWRDHAMPSAKLLSYLFNYAYVSMAMPWYDHSPTNSRPYRYVAWHYMNHLGKDYTIVDADWGTSSIVTATAGINEITDDWSVIIQNNSTARTVTINGLPDGWALPIASFEDNYAQEKPAVEIKNGTLELAMERYSLYTLKKTDEPSGLADAVDAKVRIYPAIVSDVLYIEAQSGRQKTVEIFSLQGNRVKADNLNGNLIELSLSGLQNGIYLVKVNIDGIIYNQKILKQ